MRVGAPNSRYLPFSLLFVGCELRQELPLAPPPPPPPLAKGEEEGGGEREREEGGKGLEE